MKCWFWNIDKGEQKYFSDELSKNRLRQGWGYVDKLDLRKINEKIQSNQPLDEDEQGTWARCSYMLTVIQAGDLIVVKNVPSNDQFTLVKVTGSYYFDANEDYEHILPVENIGVFHKQSALVPAALVCALNREQNPIRITNKHHQVVCDLAAGVEANTPEERTTPQPFKKKIATWRHKLLPRLREVLHSDLTNSEAEQLILEMLKRDGMDDVAWIAGAGEAGADLVCTAPIGYGIPYKLAIQVKKHPGHDGDQTGINQLEHAFAAHSVQAGILVTMADTLSPELKKRIEEAQKKYNIQVLYGDDLYSRLLELIADPALDVAD